MDRMSRHSVYTRQRSNASSVSGAPSSPTMSPMHRHVRSGSSGTTNFRRTQNQAAKAAAQRLAQVMANQTDDDGGEDEDDDEDELSFDYSLNPVLGVGLSSGRTGRPRLQALGRNPAEQPVSARSTLSFRPSVKTTVLPSAVPITLRPPTSMAENPVGAQKAMLVHARKDSYIRRGKRASFDMGASNIRDTNEDFEDEASSSGEDISSELSREEATFRQQEGFNNERETTSRVEEWIKTRDKVATKPSPRINSLRYNPSVRLEAETARDKAASSLNEPEGDMSSLQTLVKKMMLTEEEMEEVVLKRCWLARYWNLCVQHDIHLEIAGTKSEFWSSLAPDPVEVVLYAGQRAKEDNSIDYSDLKERDNALCNIDDLQERNIDSMLLVEKGLRELASLKVEDAVVLVLSQLRNPNSLKAGLSMSDDPHLSSEGHFEAFELNQEQSEDVLFKQAWLAYFWRRAKNHGLEVDIADERLQFWIDHTTSKPTSQDAVEVERGLMELKKLGIESQLWQATRKLVDPDGLFARMQPESYI